MTLIPSELKAQYDAHINANNPHKVTSKQIWGLQNVENTSDANKSVSSAFQAKLSTKVNISDIYNSTEESTSLDLTILPWSAAQGYIMNNVIETYQKQDTSELEARIAWCEQNV